MNSISKSDIDKIFGKVLKNFRVKNGFTQEIMAEKLGISRVSYENKKKTGKFIALEAKKLCKIFKVKFDYLFATEPDQKEAS